MAVNYFIGNKIVCDNFNTAMTIQRQNKAVKLITLDGTEVKNGMISGGQHSLNLFNINFGSYELDRDIKKIQTKISKLSDTLSKSKTELQQTASEENQIVRELAKNESEVENLEKQLASIKKHNQTQENVYQ